MGLGRMRTVAAASAPLEAWWRPSPQAAESMPTLVHVAGTNGKGSVSHKIALGAAQAKLRGGPVGLFTSPHVGTFRERIRLDGDMISEARAEALLEEIAALEEQTQQDLTYFELLTLTSFLHFAHERAPVAVIEAGLGGLEDSTNILPDPAVCVITTIAMDHQAILGNTLDDIARAKGGIFKKGAAVVLGPTIPDAQLALLENLAHSVGAASFDVVSRVQGEDVDTENTRVAATALAKMGVDIDVEDLLCKRPLGRFEKVAERVVLDAAHNPAAFTRLGDDLARSFPTSGGYKIHAVVAMGANKDIRGSLAALLRTLDLDVASVTVAPSDNAERTASSIDLATAAREAAQDCGFSSLRVAHADSITKAYETVDSLTTGQRDVIVVCGSFNALGKIRAKHVAQMSMDEVNMNENKV
ncbi:Folylpolyglutamate synthase [Hondaea fermentalgiana]|uniref:Folylpolyglutamate synthase n=1 Tax=Hondaea fermentalgiana TaxID=2315210 RepID=A0A2R5GMV0_9STRA|nr:Folylpolyglutamate synthase [Hondaea fermentalgiana]|eukprot:GBG32217.1 Folylpolyglutamate synthase [Hondaea fermentalgiana]